jgi:hypothetical protein
MVDLLDIVFRTAACGLSRAESFAPSWPECCPRACAETTLCCRVSGPGCSSSGHTSRCLGTHCDISWSLLNWTSLKLTGTRPAFAPVSRSAMTKGFMSSLEGCRLSSAVGFSLAAKSWVPPAGAVDLVRPRGVAWNRGEQEHVGHRGCPQSGQFFRGRTVAMQL